MAESMMRMQNNWHYEGLQKSISDLEDKRKRGEVTIAIHIGELQRLLLELLAMHQRCDHLEEYLANYAACSLHQPVLLHKCTMQELKP
jgi:hypothetical protein